MRAQDPWPAPQSALGVSLAPVAAEWIPKKSVVSGSQDPRPTFCLRYKLPQRTADMEGGYPGLLRLFDPQGRLISLSSRQYGSTVQNGEPTYFITCDAVDPRWPFIEVQWEVFDVKATLEQLGRRESSVEFKGVPLPDAAHPLVEIHRTLPTNSGLNVMLQSAQFLPDEHKIEFQLDWTPPAQFPDVQASIQAIHANAPGWKFQTSNWGAYYQNANFRLDIPTDGAKQCDLKLDWLEFSQLRSAPNLRTTLQFRVSLPKPEKAAPETPELKRISLIPFQSPHARGTLEVGAAQWNWNHSILWCETLEDAREGNWQWQPQGLSIIQPDGNTTSSGTGVLPGPFWHADGTPAHGREMPFNAQFEEKPPPFKAHLTFEKVRQLPTEQVLDLAVLPPPGQTLDKAALHVDDDIVSVERAVGYKSLTELPGFPRDLMPQFPKEGIALILKVQPVFIGSTFDLHALELFDSQNRIFTHEGDPPPMLNRDVTRAGDSTLFYTVFLPAFAPSTTDLKLRYRLIETQKSGQTEDVSFDVKAK